MKTNKEYLFQSLFALLILASFIFGYVLMAIYTASKQPEIPPMPQWTAELRNELALDCMQGEGRTAEYCLCMVDEVDNHPLQDVINEVHESTQGGVIINTAESVCLPK